MYLFFHARLLTNGFGSDYCSFLIFYNMLIMTSLLRQPISLHGLRVAFDGTVTNVPVVCQYQQHIFQSFYYFVLGRTARIESLMQIHI